MAMVWKVGGYVSNKLKSSAWGDGVVRQLAEYIHTQDPAVRGWCYRTIYKMVQLYDTYSITSFASLLAETDMKAYKHVVPFETAQMDDSVIVPFEMAQIPNVLFCTGWTNHQIVLNRCKTDAERLFYILYAGRERLENKELVRAIKTDAMSSLLSAASSLYHLVNGAITITRQEALTEHLRQLVKHITALIESQLRVNHRFT